MVYPSATSNDRVTRNAMSLPRLAEMCAADERGLTNVNGTAWLIGDLPFGSYHASPAAAYQSAATLMQAGAQMIKIEGASGDNDWLIDDRLHHCARHPRLRTSRTDAAERAQPRRLSPAGQRR